nr:hypothetical protein [Candidatus Wallbacteria bacterium]
MDPERVVKFIRSRVILIFILSFYFAQSNYSLAPANAGELDETLRKLLSSQQNKHKEDEVLNKLKKDPQSIEELFSSKQGILSKSSVFKKSSISKSVKKSKKTSVKKAAVKKDDEAQEPESLEDILTAQSLIVLDESTGKLVYSKDPFKKMAPASLTKIMTAITLLDSNKDLNEKVTIRHDIIIRSDGVSLGLKEGDQTTLM